jgi:DNA-binding PadR family transcriptional regulator
MSDLSSKEWGTSVTDDVIRALYSIKGTGFAVRGTDILYALEQDMEDPPSRMTIYRTLEGLQSEGYVLQDDENRHQLTDAGAELYEAHTQPSNTVSPADTTSC